MSSGSYFPPAVKAVPIPKKSGRERILGVPTVSDRIAQIVVTLVLEYDIRGLFDHMDHRLLLKALRHHCSERWVLLYVERWLTAPMQGKDGKRTARTVGTPQGGPISPPTILHT